MHVLAGNDGQLPARAVISVERRKLSAPAMEGQAPASPEHNYDQQGASEEAYSGYQMSGGMLVCDPAQGMEGMGEMGGDYGSQEHGEVAPMRRDLSGEASTWSATAFVRLASLSAATAERCGAGAQTVSVYDDDGAWRF